MIIINKVLENLQALRSLLLLFVFTALIMLSGCGGTMQAYNGPKLTTSEVAIIKPYSPRTPIGYIAKNANPLYIRGIDGNKLSFGEKKCEVLPGEHKVTINMPITHAGVVTEVGPVKNIFINAEAGHTYTIYGRHLFHTIKAVWVVDDTTGKIVVGDPK